MPSQSPIRSLILLSALASLLSCATTGHPSYEWPAAPTRTWVGPSLWANRLQDWRTNESRLECVEAGVNRPLRAVHLLTRSLGPKPGTVQLRVCTGVLEPELPRSAESFSGFLVGAGGEGIDYRLTALTHHRPAEDGGLVAAVDGEGRVVFRNNEHNVAKGGWGITGKLRQGELSVIQANSRKGQGFAGKPRAHVLLELMAEPSGTGYCLTLTATDTETGELLSEAVLENVDPALVSGSIALVSHLGPKRSRLGHWFKGLQVAGSKVEAHSDRSFGPILASQYTLSRGTLKLTAQMPPLGAQDTQTAELQIRKEEEPWRTVATSKLMQASYTFPFRVENWDGSRHWQYRVLYALRTGLETTQTCTWAGTIRAEPKDKEQFVVGAFTGNKNFTGNIKWNHNGIWFPHNELVRAVKHHDPDLLFFSGDQIYEGDITGAQRRPLEKAMLDYLDKWYRWCWAFGDLARDRPCICIPDDHDVYHGNLWGAGGRHAKRQDDGGYRMPADFVRMVERTQTSHLPDPYDPRPVEQGIGVYFTSLEYAGLSFAIIEDRKFKSSATVMVPAGKVVNGWFQNRNFDPAADADVQGAVLLGDRQLKFLEHWATDWQGGTWMKVLLSQTIFANVATLPKAAKSDAVVPRLAHVEVGEYPSGDKRVADADSNGWPQTGRNKALRAIRKGFALHIAGDQHLGSFTRYGVDDWDDAGYAFCVPSIANTFPRRWFPPEPGENRKPGAPKYTGQFNDGFGNHITVHAVSNPEKRGHAPTALYDRAPGYGIVRFDRKTRDVTVESWPRWVDPALPGAEQYPGWPVVINQLDNYGRKPVAWLPRVVVEGMEHPVITVMEESSGALVYALRMQSNSIRPWVFAQGSYTVEIGEPGTEKTKLLKGLKASSVAQDPIRVRF